MSTLDLTAATTASVDALVAGGFDSELYRAHYGYEITGVVLAAAIPLIVRQVADQITAAIEAEWRDALAESNGAGGDAYLSGIAGGLETAALIANEWSNGSEWSHTHG